MRLNGVEIPKDIEIPQLSAETIAEIDELHEALHRHYESMVDNPAQQAAKAPVDTKPVTISIDKLRKLEPLARAKVLYMLRDQVTP